MPSATLLPRPAERVAIISLMLVFLCGTVLGAVAMSYWEHGVHGPATRSAPTMSIAEWKDKLNLTDDQTRQLTSILDDFSRLYDDLLSDGNTRIVQILNDEQKKKYQKMMADHKRL